MVGHSPDSQEEKLTNPSPQDFSAYLPWACNQLQLSQTILVHKQLLCDMVSHATDRTRTKTKNRTKVTSLAEVFSANTVKREKTKSSVDLAAHDNNAVKIIAMLHNENLVQLKFEKNKYIPHCVLQILGLIVKFHTQLESIYINRGLDSYCIYEISKFLPLTNITDICFDGSFIREANYYILLEKPSALKQLSLSRCTIDDNIVETIASKLVYPLPASKTLSILNLSCNKITNIGAKCLAKVLRSNRQLSYLNLAGNSLNDFGASELLSTMQEFLLSQEEVFEVKRRLIVYLKNKKQVIQNIVEELKLSDQGKSRSKTKKGKAFPPNKKSKLEKDSLGNLIEDLDEFYYQKALILAEDIIGEFEDPFMELIFKNGLYYTDGNNALAYLNLSYNNIGFCAINKLLAVLKYQKILGRKPRGLIKVCIEGNPLPQDCSELAHINSLLQIALMTTDRRYPSNRKQPIRKK